MTILKRIFVFLVLSCFLFATVFSVSGCGGLASLVTAASTSLGGMEAWVFVPAAGARNISKNSPKVSPPAGFIALPGATLTIVGTGQSAVTDSSGYASITGLASGTYTVTVAKEGYKTFSYTVTVTTGVDTQVGGSGGIETEVSTAPGIMNLSATSGAIGSSVTITGVNFGSTQGDSAVKFNGTTATSITSWSSTQIVCVIPNSATTGNLVVTVGSESSNSISFTVSGSALAWRAMDSKTPENLNGVWGTSDGATVYAVGTKYTIMCYTAATGVWTEQISGLAGGAFRGVWGTNDAASVFAVGDIGNIRKSTGGGLWVESISRTGQQLNGIWGSSINQIFAAGNDTNDPILEATIRYYNDGEWNRIASSTTFKLYGIWGSSSSNIYAVGQGGAAVKFNGTAWNPLDTKSAQNLNGVWCTSDDKKVIAVCEGNGKILVSTNSGASWTESQPVSGVEVKLNGIWGSSDSDVFIVGNTGTILHYDGSAWSSMTSGTTENLCGVWGSSSSDVFVVANKGTILHYDGKGWSAMTSPTSQNLMGVWGSSSSDVFAVGAAPGGGSATILHYGTN